jgi:hypothetical protein
VSPHNRNAERAEVMAEIEVTVVADRENRFLSLRYPKNEEERMPGRLKSVSKSVADA